MSEREQEIRRAWSLPCSDGASAEEIDLAAMDDISDLLAEIDWLRARVRELETVVDHREALMTQGAAMAASAC